MNYINPKNRNRNERDPEPELLFDSYMAKAYNDKNFNSYQVGPGAALTHETQKGNNKHFMLCIKDVPSNLDELSLKRILCNHGNVISVNASRSENCNYYFAECATENDFESVLKGMRNNEFKMKVEPKTDKRNANNNENNNEEVQSKEIDERQIDFSKRTFKNITFNNPQHPKLGKENTNSDNSSKEYGFNNKNLRRPRIEFPKDEEKDSRINIIKTKAESSEGKYNYREKEFVKNCNEFAHIKLYPCNTCKKSSIRTCEKCDGFYCSVECNNKNTHKCYFNKFSSLENNLIKSPSSTSVNNKLIKSEIPKSGQTVIMTHVEQTNMVYIRSNEKTENDDYIKVINEVEKYNQNANVLKKLPNINEYVVASYNGIWYRAVVLNNHNVEEINIAYIDIGITDKKKLSELKEFLPEYYNLKCYPFVIYLKNLENCCPNDYFTNYMNKIVNNDTQLKLIYQPNDIKYNKIVAELYNLETTENINNKCIELLKPSIPKDKDEPVMNEDIKYEKLPAGENISIIVVSHTYIEGGNISCISSYEVQELNEFNDELKKYAESTDHHYTPRQGEMCIAKSDNKAWYRAFCYEIVGDGFPTLIFIDYGNVSPVSIYNIRKYPRAFTMPCKTDECSIYGLKFKAEEKDSIAGRLRELLPLYGIIMVPKIEIIDSETILHLPNIIDTLRRESLL